MFLLNPFTGQVGCLTEVTEDPLLQRQLEDEYNLWPVESSSLKGRRIRQELALHARQLHQTARFREFAESAPDDSPFAAKSRELAEMLLNEGSFPVCVLTNARRPDAVILNRLSNRANPSWMEGEMRRHARIIEKIVHGAFQRDAQLYFATLSFALSRDDDLAQIVKLLFRSWRRFCSDLRTFRSVAQEYIRAIHVEFRWHDSKRVEDGQAGWHVHIHVVFEPDPDRSSAHYGTFASMREKLLDSWGASVAYWCEKLNIPPRATNHSDVMPVETYGDPANAAKKIASYLAYGVLSGRAGTEKRDDLAPEKFLTFMEAFHGRALIRMSRGWERERAFASWRAHPFPSIFGSHENLSWRRFRELVERVVAGCPFPGEAETFRRCHLSVILSLYFQGLVHRAKQLAEMVIQHRRREAADLLARSGFVHQSPKALGHSPVPVGRLGDSSAERGSSSFPHPSLASSR